MLVKLRFPSLVEFGGAPLAVSLPEEIALPTTWLGLDNVPPKGERAKAMELQLDGSWNKEKEKDGHSWLTKAEFVALNKHLTMTDTTDDNGQTIYRGALDKLKAISDSNVGAMLTLSNFWHPDDPADNSAFICCGAPAGTMQGNAFMLKTKTTGDAAAQDGPTIEDYVKEDWSKLQPINIDAPTDINPIVGLLTRDTRATLATEPAFRQSEILSDSLVFPNGLKVTQPACLLIHKDDLPKDDDICREQFLGPAPPSFTVENEMFAVLATNKEMTEETAPDLRTLVLQRAIFLPKGHHGIPLAVMFDKDRCNNGAALKTHCQEFTELPDEAYTWMLENPILDAYLAACSRDPENMKLDTYFMSQVADSWTAWKMDDTLDAQKALAYPETKLRFRWLWDNLRHTLTAQWCKKLTQYEDMGMAILHQSPDVAEWQKQYFADAIHLPALINPRTKLWMENFRIQFFRDGLWSHWDSFARVDMPPDNEDLDPSLRIENTTKIAERKSPDSVDKRSAANNAAGLLAAMGFLAKAATPKRAPTIAEEERSRAASQATSSPSGDSRKRKGMSDSGIKKILGFTEVTFPRDDDSCKYLGKKSADRQSPPRIKFDFPASATVTVITTSKLFLPYEQPSTHMEHFFRDGIERLESHQGEFLWPTTSALTDRFTRTAYVEEGLDESIALTAHFGAYAVDPKMHMGPRDGSNFAFPDYELLLPGYIANKYITMVLKAKLPSNVTTYFHNELRAAQQSQLETYARPSFVSTDFYTTADNVRALQSGMLAAGDEPSCSFTAYITPWSFIQTIQKHGHRLSSSGLECAKLVQLLKNMAWYFHVQFTNQVRYPVLRAIHPELSPWLLASPFAGQLAWIINLLSHQRLQDTWSDLSDDRRLTCSVAVINHICSLWRIFLDWALPRDPDHHCARVLLFSQKSRSDVAGFKAYIQNNNFKRLDVALLEWRTQATDGFDIDNLKAKATPTSGPFKRHAPDAVLPAKHSNSQPAKAAGNNSQTTQQARQTTGTYLKAPQEVARWRDGTKCTAAAMRKLFSTLNKNRPPIRAPFLNNKQICFFYMMADSPGCDTKDCPRHHINIRNTQVWNKETLRPLTEFLSLPAVNEILQPHNAYLDLTR